MIHRFSHLAIIVSHKKLRRLFLQQFHRGINFQKVSKFKTSVENDSKNNRFFLFF